MHQSLFSSTWLPQFVFFSSRYPPEFQHCTKLETPGTRLLGPEEEQCCGATVCIRTQTRQMPLQNTVPSASVQGIERSRALCTARLRVPSGQDPGTRKQLNEQQNLIINFFFLRTPSRTCHLSIRKTGAC